MTDTSLPATLRTEFGKGPSRRLRMQHQVPAVLYGHGSDPLHLALPGHETMLALKQANALLTLVVEGQSDQLALVKAVQRDPLTSHIEHLDLVLVRRGEKVVVDVPVVTHGDVVGGAVLTIEHATLSIRAEATALPQAIELDVEGLEIGATIMAGEITLPEGAELVTDADAAVVIVAAPQAEAPTGEATEGEGGAEAADEAGEQA
jgi:large subunit ribosomal protein L25